MKYLILAGGSGSSLWPLSRKLFTKQFFRLIDDKSLLQDTALRVSKKSGKDIYIVTTYELKFIVLDQMNEIFTDFKEENLIIEPEPRSTAPAIIYSSLFFKENDIIAVLPSDHYIKSIELLNKNLNDGQVIAKQGYISTIGLKTENPNTNYGYIKKGNKEIENGFHAVKFIEKPNILSAEEYVSDPNYYWNAGIFIYKNKTFTDELHNCSPNAYKTFQKLKKKIDDNSKITVDDYRDFENNLIDYVLMEKTDKIVVIPSDLEWSDVGSFEALYKILPQDQNNNALKIKRNNFINIGSENLLLISNKRKVATINVKNLVIVDTADALLIADKEYCDEVKTVYRYLEENEEPEYHHHIKVYRPWGSFLNLYQKKDYRVKQLHISPGKRISLQYHNYRCETWTIVSGKADIINGDDHIILNPSETVFIPEKNKHRLYNPSETEILEVIEVQRGNYLEEDDIIRLQDDFNRE